MIFLKDKSEMILKKAVENKIFPGAVFGISGDVKGKREILTVACGNIGREKNSKPMDKDVFFDLASLTKPLATTLAILCLLREGKIEREEPLSSLLERKVDKQKEKILLENLLNHSSGLSAYAPYYKELIHQPQAERKENITLWILGDKLQYKIGSKSLYSDLGFILLGRIIELKAQQPLDRFVVEKVYRPLGIEGMFFIPLTGKSSQKTKSDRVFAPTEKCPWRGRVLSGEVHDDNAFALGGVAGHAGLFGDIESVLRLTTFLLDVWQGKAEHPFFYGEDLRTFFKKQRAGDEETWALGFDTPALKGSSSGHYLSTSSVGHLGFTGTSFWIDREKDLVVILLSNRVHPRRDNEAIRGFRPVFHNEIVLEYLQRRQR